MPDSSPRREAHNRRQRAHFDTSSLSNPRMLPSRSPYISGHLDRLLAVADLRPGDRVLDVGCGQGKFSLPLIDRGFEVAGLDLSPDLLDALQGHLEGRSMELHWGDLLDPPAELHEAFDAVVGFFMLHHLPDLVTAFEGVRRCLRPGGVAAFLEPNGYSPLFAVQITLTPKMSWRSDKGVFKMRRKLLVAAAHQAGFDRVDHRWTGLFPPAITNHGGAAVERLLDRVGSLGVASSFQLITATTSEHSSH